MYSTSLDLKISYDSKMKQFTIIIPIFNEVDSIFNLLSEIEKVFKSKNIEILIVDDGSSDDFKEKRKFLKKF